MENNVAVNQEYREWLKGIKGYIRNQQVKAAVRVNEELLKVYWKLGEDICIHKAEAQWGSVSMSR